MKKETKSISNRKAIILGVILALIVAAAVVFAVIRIKSADAPEAEPTPAPVVVVEEGESIPNSPFQTEPKELN